MLASLYSCTSNCVVHFPTPQCNCKQTSRKFVLICYLFKNLCHKKWLRCQPCFDARTSASGQWTPPPPTPSVWDCIHMYIIIHIYIHTHAYTCIQICIISIWIHTMIHISIRIHIHTHTHTYTFRGVKTSWTNITEVIFSVHTCVCVHVRVRVLV